MTKQKSIFQGIGWGSYAKYDAVEIGKARRQTAFTGISAQ